MVSRQERRRLIEAFERESLVGAAIVIKCIWGLLIVAGIAFIGVQSIVNDTATIAAMSTRDSSE